MKDKIQLYSMATPNGVKISIMLEEIGLPYEAHLVNIMKGEQFSETHLKLNPNGKIPAIIDPNGPNGTSISLMETGAILIYLAEKSGQLLSKDPIERMNTLQWLFFQVAHIGPMFGQFAHFYKFAKDKCDHPYPVERYTNETQRLLGVLETQLNKTEFIASDTYSIADISIIGWVRVLDKVFNATEILELSKYPKVLKWRDAILSRPAVQRGVNVCTLQG